MDLCNFCLIVVSVIVFCAKSSRCQESFVLDCIFNRPVAGCVWVSNGKRVAIPSDTHQFVSGEGYNTKTCSIEFLAPDRKDEGNWDCYYKQTLSVSEKPRIWSSYNLIFKEDPHIKPPKNPKGNGGASNHYSEVSYIIISIAIHYSLIMIL